MKCVRTSSDAATSRIRSLSWSWCQQVSWHVAHTVVWGSGVELMPAGIMLHTQWCGVLYGVVLRRICWCVLVRCFYLCNMYNICFYSNITVRPFVPWISSPRMYQWWQCAAELQRRCICSRTYFCRDRDLSSAIEPSALQPPKPGTLSHSSHSMSAKPATPKPSNLDWKHFLFYCCCCSCTHQWRLLMTVVRPDIEIIKFVVLSHDIEWAELQPPD